MTAPTGPTTAESHYVVYGDGSVLRNGHPDAAGGYGYWIERGSQPFWMGGGRYRAPHPTNNVSELLAVLVPLAFLVKRIEGVKEVTLVSDSRYVVNGVNSHVFLWAQRGFRKSDGGQVSNENLWRVLYAYHDRIKIQAQWVRGHQAKSKLKGNSLRNQIVDDIAGLFVRNEGLAHVYAGRDLLEDYSSMIEKRLAKERLALLGSCLGI